MSGGFAWRTFYSASSPELNLPNIGSQLIWVVPRIIHYPPMLHPYQYCRNNPVNMIDPTGEIPPDAASCLLCQAAVVIGCYWGCWGHPQYLECVGDCLDDTLESECSDACLSIKPEDCP